MSGFDAYGYNEGLEDHLAGDDEVGFDFMSLASGLAGGLSGAMASKGGAAGGADAKAAALEKQRLQKEEADAESSKTRWKIAGIVILTFLGLGGVVYAIRRARSSP